MGHSTIASSPGHSHVFNVTRRNQCHSSASSLKLAIADAMRLMHVATYLMYVRIISRPRDKDNTHSYTMSYIATSTKIDDIANELTIN